MQRRFFAVLPCALLAASGAAKSALFSGGFETLARPPVTLASAYDETLIQPPSPAPTLVVNGGFEESGAWTLCGAAQTIEDPTAPEGLSVLQLSGVGSDCVERLIVDNTDAAAVLPITLSTSSEFYTLSFHAHIAAPLSGGNLVIEVSEEENAPEALFQFFVDSIDDRTRGWEQFKIVFSRSSLESSVSSAGPLYLAFLAEGLADQAILIDNVRLINGVEALQSGQPMPEELRQVSDRERLLIEQLEIGRLATVTAGGKDLRTYPADLSFADAPGWSDENRLLLAESITNPALDPVPDPSVIVALGSSLREFDALGEDATALLTYAGDPGVFLGSGDPGNKDALDVEINQVAFADEGGHYVTGVCAANRSILGITGVACFLDLRRRGSDESRLVSDALSPTLSDRGGLAFIRNNAIVLADAAGDTETVVYQGIALNTDLGRALAWSNDARQLAFAQSGNGFTLIEGEREAISAVKILSVQSGEVRTVATIDQGRVGRTLAWSTDDDYLFYTVTLGDGREQVWWLRVVDGATGPVTNTLTARLWGAAR